MWRAGRRAADPGLVVGRARSKDMALTIASMTRRPVLGDGAGRLLPRPDHVRPAGPRLASRLGVPGVPSSNRCNSPMTCSADFRPSRDRRTPREQVLAGEVDLD